MCITRRTRAGLTLTCSVALVLAAFNVGSLAQTATFEVASVKVNASGRPGSDVNFRIGQFTATNVTLRVLIAEAYGLETFRILDGPDWIDRERFDVQARADSGVTRAQTGPMLQALLAERFALRARMERRERPIYALVTSRRDGTLGPRLVPASPSACTARPVGARVPTGELPNCGQLPSRPGRAFGRSVGLDVLATELSRIVDRVVVNRTGRSGVFDLDLEWTVDQARQPGGIDPDQPPDLAAALEEQLGLRLQPTTGPVDVLIVDGAERPPGN